MLIITFVNTGRPGDIADYTWKAFINHEQIAQGFITDHNRKNGWENLVQMMLDKERSIRKDES